MAEVEVDEIHGGWRVVAGQKDGVDIVVEVTGATLKANQIRAVLTVRVDDAVAFRDTCSLTSQRGRAKIIAALQAKGIAVDDGVLVILDEACRMPSRRPAAASATGSDATRTVPLPNLLGEIEAIVRRYVMIPADRAHGGRALDRAHVRPGRVRRHAVPECHLASEAVWQVPPPRGAGKPRSRCLVGDPSERGGAIPQDRPGPADAAAGRGRCHL